MMTAGQKIAFCRLVSTRGRSPVLACHDLEITSDDLLDAMLEDWQFCRDAFAAFFMLNYLSFEERFPTD